MGGAQNVPNPDTLFAAELTVSSFYLRKILLTGYYCHGVRPPAIERVSE